MKVRKLTAVFLAMLVIMLLLTYMPINTIHAESQADALVSIALAEEGYTEGSNNDNKYGAYFGHNNVSWCAYFISWCARQAGIPESIIKINGWAGSMGSSQRTGNFGGTYYPNGSITPQKGDIVYYDGSDVNGESGHVEIVISYDSLNNTINSIGGNTGGGTRVYIHKNQSLSTRGTSMTIIGFERPNYSGSVNPPVQNNDDELGIEYPRPQVSSTVWLGKNGITSGNYVKWLQTALNKADNAGLVVDGQFGSGTTTAVKNFQAKHGLTQDGQAGTATINKLVEIIKCGIKPILDAPNLYVDVRGQEVTFSWNLVSNATHYDMRIYYSDGSSYKDFWGGSDMQTSLTLTLPANTEFNVQVCAANKNYENCWTYCNPVTFSTGVNGSIVDVGTDFYAIISNVNTKYLLSNINGNATMSIPTDKNNQYWYFSRNENGSYTIESYDRTQALDVAGGETVDGTNIGLYEKNGTLAQQWYLYWADGGMYFKSALGNYCMDVNDGVSNAYLWQSNETTAQIFEFYRIDLDGTMPVDMGEYFFAKIINNATGKALANIDNANLAGEDSEYKEEQTWCFIKKDNGSYKIMSYYDVDQSLDIMNFGIANATNVGVCIDSNNIAQRFFLYEIDGDIYIKAMCSNNVFDMDLNTMNVSTWNYVKGVDPERFSIQKVEENKDVKIEIIQNPNKLVYNVGEKLDTNGLVIKQIYETGSSFTTSSGFTVDKTLLKIGDNEVTVSYEGKTATFNIIVNLLKGDANNDGIIDVADVVAVASYVGNPESNKLDSQGMLNADVHNTGNGLTADDALMIQQYLAKIIEKL